MYLLSNCAPQSRSFLSRVTTKASSIGPSCIFSEIRNDGFQTKINFFSVSQLWCEQAVSVFQTRSVCAINPLSYCTSMPELILKTIRRPHYKATPSTVSSPHRIIWQLSYNQCLSPVYSIAFYRIRSKPKNTFSTVQNINGIWWEQNTRLIL